MLRWGYASISFSHQKETLFDEKLNKRFIEFFFQIATFFNASVYTYIYMNVFLYIVR